MRKRTHVAIRPLLPRGVILWALIRLVFAALPLTSGGSEPVSPSPLGIVGLAGLVGLIDIHARAEGFLWANLGVSRRDLFVIYGAAAVVCELMLAVVLA